ncbi:toxin-antitoxin system YwqK family antitoxin [Tenacibaculum sp. IB213877]|uniref:toxin-antitoxin system YwqK family antitoxin n=1 Tax=Tenacibaculum sp. IB213877 TaxID=3097351 RepID=UPI002A5A7458|nr:toxin-antitoxin system YwqK family antitoxin [Tenacibaculum sp. IB213877]MDY0781454.1 toxin-antitoxin system YwqK family antitoxin [Tenacibaculum sp. IB213877]
MIKIRRQFIAITISLLFFSIAINAQEVNQLDANGKRTGVWRKYHDNGKLRYTGQFENGKEIGTFKFYTKYSSVPSIIKEYTVNSDTALVKFYTNKGRLKSLGNMIGKNRVGLWSYYFTNGKIFSEEYYVNGKLEGVVKNFYANGKVTEETNYKNGLKNGVSKIFTESGILIEEVQYVNGKLNGEAKYYDLKGNLKEKGMYKDGSRDGKWEFYIDGEISDKPKRTTHTIKKQQ